MDNKDINTTTQGSAGQEADSHFRMEHWHIISILLVLFDLIASAGAYFLALWLRFDCRFGDIPADFLTPWLYFAPAYAVISVVVYWKMHLYQSIWRFASFVELERIAVSSFILCITHTVLITLLFHRMPITYYVFGAAIQFMLVLCIRFSYRFVLLERSRKERAIQSVAASRVMLIGAGSAGQLILRDLHNTREINECVCCIIDDNRNKWGRSIDGVPIVGGREDILLNVEKYRIEKIYLAIPSATPEQIRDILNICQETTCELKNLPAVYGFADDNVTAKSLKDVAVEDLLGRDPVKVNMEDIHQFIAGKTILVTGGGGSIGSELCRQIAQRNPKKLIVFDIYENNAHAIGLELKDNYPDLDLEAFCHGAMCISYSGRCLLSNYMVGRDANQGACTHPCRWKYSIVEETRPGEYYPVFENERGTYIFNSKDLCMIEHIPELIESGVDSLKIEGRMKTALYVATVARTYRKAIDDYKKDPELYKQNMPWYLDQISNCTYRQFTTGFFFGKPSEESQIYDSNTYVKEYTYLGIIGEEKNGTYRIEQRNKFSVGETIEVMKPNGENIEVVVKRILTEDGVEQESAPHPKQVLYVDLGTQVDKYDILRRQE